MKRVLVAVAALAAFSAPLPAFADEVPAPPPECEPSGTPEGYTADEYEALELHVFELRMRLEDKKGIIVRKNYWLGQKDERIANLLAQLRVERRR